MADIIIRPLIGSAASDALLHQWYELFAANRGEAFPGFPMPGFEAFAARRRRAAGELDPGPGRAWAAWDGELLLGVGTAVYLERDFPEYAVPSVDVHPDHRRRGVGTALLRALLADASAEGRGMLVQEQVRIGSPGEAWVRATGFTEVLRNRWQMLDVPATDPARWDVPVPEGFRLAQWVGAAPEPLVSAFAAARNAIGDAPTGESGYEAPEWTVARVREEEARSAAAGESMHHAVAVHEATGAVAALTGVLVMPPRVDLVWQRDTAVAGDFRGRGLGRVVKAAMMRALLAEHPGLGRVVTSTAAHNAAMIRVNERIGYAPYAEIGVFEASVAQLEAVLGTAAANLPGPRREAPADETGRRPGQGESAQPESAQGESAQGESAQGESAQDESAQDESALSIS